MMFSLKMIQESEKRLFLISFTILSLIVAITKILKVIKDTLVVTDPDIGAQLIPFLKTWALIPLSILFIKFLVSIRSRYSYRRTYCIITTLFMGLLGIYVYFLRYVEAWVCPHAFIQSLKAPQVFKGFLLMIEYWPLSVFYVTCDLWSIVMLSMLFWTYIGEVVTYEQGSRFFPIFSLDPSGILIGPLVMLTFIVASGSWEGQLQLLMGVVALFGLIQMGLFYLLCDKTKKEPPLSAKKKRVNWKDMMELARHPFFGSLALTVFLFEFTDNLFDVLWKGTLGDYLSDPESFSRYLANVTTFSGILATIVALFFSHKLLRRFEWFHVAVIPPLLLGILCSCFFVCYFFPSFAASLGRPFGLSALGLVVLIGAIQTSFMATAKQTIFDNTRDLAFQACSSDERGMARGFSDAFSTRLGKSASSLTHQSFMMAGATLGIAAPYIMGFVGLSLPIWISAAAVIGSHLSARLSVEGAS